MFRNVNENEAQSAFTFRNKKEMIYEVLPHSGMKLKMKNNVLPNPGIRCKWNTMCFHIPEWDKKEAQSPFTYPNWDWNDKARSASTFRNKIEMGYNVLQHTGIRWKIKIQCASTFRNKIEMNVQSSQFFTFRYKIEMEIHILNGNEATSKFRNKMKLCTNDVQSASTFRNDTEMKLKCFHVPE